MEAVPGLTPELYRLWLIENAFPPEKDRRAWRAELTPEERAAVARLDAQVVPPRRWQPIRSRRCPLGNAPGTFAAQLKAEGRPISTEYRKKTQAEFIAMGKEGINVWNVWTT